MTLAADDGFAAARHDKEPLIGAAMAITASAFRVAGSEHHFGGLGGAVAGNYAESPAEP